MFAGTLADGPPQAEWRPPWAVRFNPPQPGEGDNFAIALNTSDLSTVLDFAFSFVHADGAVVDQSNRAYALANCMACVAVAIAFQLVLISDSANVVIPDNLAVAITGSCVSCVTYALAIQLVVSLTGPLSDGAMGQLDQLWERLAQLEEELGGAVPIAEAEARLMDIEADILQVLVDDGAVALGPSVASDDGSTNADSPSSTGSTTTTPMASTPPEETTTTTTASPDPEPTTSTTEPTTTTTAG
jgi:putative peptide zinc metalloprotease protein